MALEVKNLVKTYGEYTAVNNLSFSIDKPGVFGLLGTNGAGKTTTIRMILGMLAKNSGEILWNGKRFNSSEVSVGYLAEERGIYPKISLFDQLVYFGELRGLSKKEAIKSIEYWLERLNITEYKNKAAEKLSKGNQQKAQLIAALVSDPEILVLDEPLSGLDPVNTDLFKDIINEQIDKGKYIIMSSHQMSTIEQFCTDLLILKKGNTVLQGNLKEIKKSYGRTNLMIKCDEDITEIVSKFNIELVEKNIEYSAYKVKSEKQANDILKELVSKDIQVIKFELREPTLHEIFIDKVGEDNE